jgi:DNA (cytosine-5)-methyltransferase 1
MANYYNEFEPYAADWLRNLIKAGHIPDGEVDTRSIVDVQPYDLRGFTQWHFFAGISGWSRALRIAQWPEDRSIASASLPCQPFSNAGKQKGKDDERHLWPVFFRLVTECRFPTIIGEQTASKLGREWLSGVRSDLEGVGYVVGAADLCAASIKAPHIRQRLFWVAKNMAHPDGQRPQGQRPDSDTSGRRGQDVSASGLCGRAGDGDMADAACGRYAGQDKQAGVLSGPVERREGHSDMADAPCKRELARPDECASNGGSRFIMAGTESGSDGIDSGSVARLDMAHPDSGGCGGRQKEPEWGEERRVAVERAGPWDDAEWLTGADGKTRRAKPGVRLLAASVSGGVAFVRTTEDGTEEKNVYSRVGALRCFGNAIVPPLAAEFIKAIMDTERD